MEADVNPDTHLDYIDESDGDATNANDACL